MILPEINVKIKISVISNIILILFLLLNQNISSIINLTVHTDMKIIVIRIDIIEDLEKFYLKSNLLEIKLYLILRIIE